MNIDIEKLTTSASEMLVAFGFKFLGAIAIWIIGRWLINTGLRLMSKSRMLDRVDDTARRYVQASLGVLLNIVLIVAILGFFGVETTTFAAVLAAAGVASGMAWSGLLANFASGIFIMVLRPFEVGDFIEGAGVTGTVEEVGLFVTTINTPDNVRTFVGNDSVFKGKIQNYSANPFRRVDLVAQLNHGVDHREAIEALRAKIEKIENVKKDPGVDLVIVSFNLAGPVLAVRPYCHTDHYWQVYFDTNEAIRDAFGEAGFPVPAEHLQLAGQFQNVG